jgi:hypothetical protein
VSFRACCETRPSCRSGTHTVLTTTCAGADDGFQLPWMTVACRRRMSEYSQRECRWSSPASRRDVRSPYGAKASWVTGSARSVGPSFCAASCMSLWVGSGCEC